MDTLVHRDLFAAAAAAIFLKSLLRQTICATFVLEGVYSPQMNYCCRRDDAGQLVVRGLQRGWSVALWLEAGRRLTVAAFSPCCWVCTMFEVRGHHWWVGKVKIGKVKMNNGTLLSLSCCYHTYVSSPIGWLAMKQQQPSLYNNIVYNINSVRLHHALLLQRWGIEGDILARVVWFGIKELLYHCT